MKEGSRCSQASHVSVSVPRLTPVEFGSMLVSVRAAAAAVQRRITAAEDAALPRQPRTAFEFFAYAELGLRKALAAFRLIPDFAALSIANQMLLLQVLFT